MCRAPRLVYGSPPRAWGQWLAALMYDVCARFTPTGVGTILWCERPRSSATVHPHGRGDNVHGHNPKQPAVGSPPRAWGQYARAYNTLSLTRFTPTGVGTIAAQLRRVVVDSVHPHGRGDNVGFVFWTAWRVGSPPRAWGQFRMSTARRGFGTVHPHGRGDNCGNTLTRADRRWFTPTGVGTMIIAFRVHTLAPGSPPRAWGQWWTVRLSCWCALVHPHGRGDNEAARALTRDMIGSPPRAWGQFCGRPVRQRVLRFTPTGVGTILASQAF